MTTLTKKDVEDLNNCETISEMIQLLEIRFNLHKKPGPTVRTLFVQGLVQGIEMLKPDRRLESRSQFTEKRINGK